ncbi:MAG: hypothetical protein ACJAYC_000662 [Halieaceae bacterium]|jgi:hypothetical protein
MHRGRARRNPEPPRSQPGVLRYEPHARLKTANIGLNNVVPLFAVEQTIDEETAYNQSL